MVLLRFDNYDVMLLYPYDYVIVTHLYFVDTRYTMGEREGKQMSLYGKYYLSPEEMAGLWKNVLRVRSYRNFENPLKRFSYHTFAYWIHTAYSYRPKSMQFCLNIHMNCRFFLQRTERIRRNHLANNGDGSKLWSGIKQWSSNELESMKDSFYGKRTRTTVVSYCGLYVNIF